jgi:ABC-type nitrate/sulfonate/bicarbonate transport system permease component
VIARAHVGTLPSARAEDGTRRLEIFKTRACGVGLIVVLLLFWEASVQSGLVRSTNWPAFSEVLKSLFLGLIGGELLWVTLDTLWRMLRGYALGCTIGVPLGVAIASSPLARKASLPSIDVLRVIPIPAVIPPLIFLLGVGDGLKLFSIAFAVVFPVTISSAAGVAAVEPVYRQVAKTFGVSSVRTIWQVILPAALPFIFAGLRTSLGLALVVTVVSEMIVGQDGVGYFLNTMLFALRASDMYASIVLLTCVAYGVNWLFVLFEARAIRWARLRETLGEPL